MENFKKIDINELVRRFKVGMIVTAVIAVILGVLMIVAPFVMSGVIVWIIIGVTGLYSIAVIANFFFPKEGFKRNGWELALGLIVLACVVVLILCACFATGVNVEGIQLSGFGAVTARMLFFLAILFGVLGIIEGIATICVSAVNKQPQYGWYIVGGVLSIVIGVLALIFPSIYLMVGMIIAGVYLIVLAIAIIVAVVKLGKAQKAIKKEAEINTAEAIDNKE